MRPVLDKSMRIVALETSCDETSVAILESHHGASLSATRILANVVLSQLEEHAEYGGVVPELASRAHIRHIGPVVRQAFTMANLKPHQVDAVAVTVGPGLIGGLLVGLATAKGLALAAGIPLVGVHHMEGHLLSPFLGGEEQDSLRFPFVALLVSGGHTILIHARDVGDYIFLGQTRDDAVGEAFDKGARLLGLAYPGGPAIEHAARHGNPNHVRFPRIMLDKDRFDFSFSGIKTALRSHLLALPPGTKPPVADIAASYQEAIVDTLVAKAMRACDHAGCSRLLVSGGVGANQRLRTKMLEKAGSGMTIHFPPLELCTDNAAMIGLAGMVRLKKNPSEAWMELDARARWPFWEMCAASPHRPLWRLLPSTPLKAAP